MLHRLATLSVIMMKILIWQRIESKPKTVVMQLLERA